MVKGNPLKGHSLARKPGCSGFMAEQMAWGIALTCVQISVTQSSSLFSHTFPLFASCCILVPFFGTIGHLLILSSVPIPFSPLVNFLYLNYVFISGKSTWIFYKHGQWFLNASCPLCIFKLFSLRMLNICLEFFF